MEITLRSEHDQRVTTLHSGHTKAVKYGLCMRRGRMEDARMERMVKVAANRRLAERAGWLRFHTYLPGDVMNLDGCGEAVRRLVRNVLVYKCCYSAIAIALSRCTGNLCICRLRRLTTPTHTYHTLTTYHHLTHPHILPHTHSPLHFHPLPPPPTVRPPPLPPLPLTDRQLGGSELPLLYVD